MKSTSWGFLVCVLLVYDMVLIQATLNRLAALIDFFYTIVQFI